jgi:hypothetical protein
MKRLQFLTTKKVITMIQFEKNALVICIETDDPRHKLYEIQTSLLEILQRATADTTDYPENYSLWKIYDLQKELIPEPETV